MKGPIDITAELQLIDRSDAEFYKHLKIFLSAHPNYSAANTLEAHNYSYLTYCPLEDASVVFLSLGRPIAFFTSFLYVKEIDGHSVALFSLTPDGTGLPEPLFHPLLSQKQRNKLTSIFLEQLKEKFHRTGCLKSFALYDVSALDCDNLDVCSSVWVDKTDEQPILCFEDIVDLNLSEAELWAGLRHSLKSTTNKGNRLYTFKCYDHTTILREHLELHRKLHFIAAGRHTRSLKSFEAMHDYVVKGRGIFHVQYLGDRPIQTLYTLWGSNSAYGGSMGADTGVDLPVPPTHSLNWNMLMAVKRYGVRYYHTRYTSLWSPRDWVNPLPCLDDQKKLRNLALFKSGFGGRRVPFLRVKVEI